MSSPNPLETSGVCPDQKRVERAERFLRDVLSNMNSYHNHKENLAHASIAVMGGLVGGILITDNWPPDWVTCYYSYSNAITLIVFFILWLLIHLYMRWQLRQRRSAAIMYNAGSCILAKWNERTPTANDFKSHFELGQRSRRFNRFCFYLDHFIVVRKGVLVEDNANYYPNWLMARYEQERNEMHGILAEWIVTLASFGLLFLVCLRTNLLGWTFMLLGFGFVLPILLSFFDLRSERNSG